MPGQSLASEQETYIGIITINAVTSVYKDSSRERRKVVFMKRFLYSYNTYLNEKRCSRNTINCGLYGQVVAKAGLDFKKNLFT